MEMTSYLRFGSCHGSAIGSPLGVTDYKLICICISSQDTGRLPERIDARNPQLSLARITGTDKIV